MEQFENGWNHTWRAGIILSLLGTTIQNLCPWPMVSLMGQFSARLCLTCMLPFGHILQNNSLVYHSYANDTQTDLLSQAQGCCSPKGQGTKTKEQVKNLGVLIDSDLSFNSHIKAIKKSAFYHLKNIMKVRDLMTKLDAEKLIHAFISAKLITAMDFWQDFLKRPSGTCNLFNIQPQDFWPKPKK